MKDVRGKLIVGKNNQSNDKLTRDEFRKQVFARDGNKCVFCNETEDLAAHHILDRALFQDGSQGYLIDNGATVCSECHLLCEMTLKSVESVRKACKIKTIIVPEGFDPNIPIDKWANPILLDGLRRLKGPMFNKEGVQKILKRGKVLHLFGYDRI